MNPDKMNPDKIRAERLARFKDDPENDKQLPLIADEIRARCRAINLHIYETGGALTEAKAFLEHGEFKAWIKGQKFKFSYQTANNFMNVYRTCLGRPQLVQTIPSSILYQIASPGFPKDLGEYLYTNADGLKKIKNKTIRDISRRVKKGELPLDDPQVLGLVEFRQKKQQSKGFEAELNVVFDKLETIGKTVVKLSSGIIWPILPGKDQTIMTEEQAQRVTDVIADMVEHIENMKPVCELVKRIHPRLVVSGE